MIVCYQKLEGWVLDSIILDNEKKMCEWTSLDVESDFLDKCVRCKHQKVDHDRSASRDKMKCLIGDCNCKTFKPDKKYYRSSKK